MKFELISKHKAKLTKVDIQSAKRGQTDTVPAVALTFEVTLPNSDLNMLDKSLLPFLYEKGASSAQQTLEGVAVVSDMPVLTRAASRLGTLSWDDEQSGSAIVIYQGVTGDGDIKLSGGMVTIKKIEAHEGGAWDATVTYYVEDLDSDTLGALAVLKSHDVDIELTAPEVTQRTLDDQDEDDGDGEGWHNPFPVDGDTDGPDAAAQSPFLTPEQALSNAVGGEASATVITKRRSRLAAVSTAGAAE